MKLSRALKLRKKLAGEIAHLQQLISVENVSQDENESKFVVENLWVELHYKQTKLVSVKTAIAVGNAGIWESIFQIVELKGQVTFLRNLDTKEGTFNEASYHQEALKRTYKPQIDKVRVEKEIKNLEVQIEELQDKIDDYNQSHTVAL